MKAKIIRLDPTGVEVTSKEFEVPLIADRNRSLSSGLPQEPMLQYRYLLEIGKYQYFIRSNGDIEPINIPL